MTGDVEKANGVVRMMLLDASFTDAPASAHATAPSVCTPSSSQISLSL